MKVFKFGGASVKDAEAVRNMARILKNYRNEQLVVIISAMGKTTNALEKVLASWYEGKDEAEDLLFEVDTYHQNIIAELFPDRNHPVYARYETWMGQLNAYLSEETRDNYDFDYDQIVSLGELISTTIIHEYISTIGIGSCWLDVRSMIRTDNSWREAKVDWAVTGDQIIQELSEAFGKHSVVITQGFLGSTAEGETTTLGREGSDYSAAIFSYALDATEMIIWKDVPGLLNADPKYFSKTEKLASISYREAIELSYYGATIIHPKTIKPLQNKNIPLRIKSFIDIDSEGSIIHESTSFDSQIPSFIFKVEQVLISISPRDFSFIDEQSLSEIIAVFAEHNVHIHLMQNTALSFSVCVDNNERRLGSLFEILGKSYKILYNTGLELITIRHYDQATINRVMRDGKSILLEMRSRATAQFVVRPIGKS